MSEKPRRGRRRVLTSRPRRLRARRRARSLPQRRPKSHRRCCPRTQHCFERIRLTRIWRRGRDQAENLPSRMRCGGVLPCRRGLPRGVFCRPRAACSASQRACISFGVDPPCVRCSPPSCELRSRSTPMPLSQQKQHPLVKTKYADNVHYAAVRGGSGEQRRNFISTELVRLFSLKPLTSSYPPLMLRALPQT